MGVAKGDARSLPYSSFGVQDTVEPMQLSKVAADKETGQRLLGVYPKPQTLNPHA